MESGAVRKLSSGTVTAFMRLIDRSLYNLSYFCFIGYVIMPLEILNEFDNYM